MAKETKLKAPSKMNKTELEAELVAAKIKVNEGTTNKKLVKILTDVRKGIPIVEVKPPVEPKEKEEVRPLPTNQEEGVEFDEKTNQVNKEREEPVTPPEFDGDEPADKVPAEQADPVDPASTKETNTTESLVATPKGVMRRVVKTIDEVVVKDTKIKGSAVFTKDDEFVRIYTPEDHKGKANDLAKQFAKKIGGKVVSN